MKLADFRAEMGWTQQQMADRCGVTVQHYQRVESGRSPPSWALARLIKRDISGGAVTYDDLFGGADDRASDEAGAA